MSLEPSFDENTSKTSLKFAWKLSTHLPASPHVKNDDVRSIRSNYFSEKFIHWDTGLRWKQSLFKSGAIIAADRAVSLECHDKLTVKPSTST